MIKPEIRVQYHLAHHNLACEGMEAQRGCIMSTITQVAGGKGKDQNFHSLFNVFPVTPHCHNPKRPNMNEAHSKFPEVFL